MRIPLLATLPPWEWREALIRAELVAAVETAVHEQRLREAAVIVVRPSGRRWAALLRWEGRTEYGFYGDSPEEAGAAAYWRWAAVARPCDYSPELA